MRKNKKSLLLITSFLIGFFITTCDDVLSPANSKNFDVYDNINTFTPITGITNDGIIYSETATVTITGYDGSGGVVGIPSLINGKPVVAIANADTSGGVFQGKNLTGVNIPNGITFIGSDAFRDNRLTGITLPASLISIGDNAFKNNRLTGSLAIPDSVTAIGNHAFFGGNSIRDGNRLTGIIFGANVISIGNHAFSNNRLAGSLVIPGKVTHIGSNAFSNNELAKVSIPPSVITIEDGAFLSNPTLCEINVDLLNENFISIDGVLYNEDGSKLIKWPPKNTSPVIIPGAVTAIDDWAFAGTGLTGSLIIPNNVKFIGKQAFLDSFVTSITIGENVMFGSSSLPSFNGNFDAVYNNAGRAAGTYTRRTNISSDWAVNKF